MSSLDNKKEQMDINWWRSLQQLHDDPEYRKFADSEFPDDGDKKEINLSRRSFLSVMGASLALAGFTGCRRPVEKIVPYVDAPEKLVLGEPEYYATTMPFSTSAYGVIVTSVEGRPIKIEGNDLHPSTKGKSNSFIQSSILNLYDPDRSKETRHNNEVSSFNEFVTSWNEIKTEYDGNGGEGLAVLCEESTSPTLARLKKEISRKYPKIQWVVFDSVSDENIYHGIELATGKSLSPVHSFEKAKVIVALDADPLATDSENVSNALGFARGRKVSSPTDSMNRLYVAEPGYSITGAMADHRFRVPSKHILEFAIGIGEELEALGLKVPALRGYKRLKTNSCNRDWMKAIAGDLVKNLGESLVVAGRRQDPAVHALITTINHALGNTGKTLKFVSGNDIQVSDRKSFASLVKDMDGGKISTLFIIGGDPVSNAPADVDLTTALSKVKNAIHLGHQKNQTAKVCGWHINRTHYLESWGDCRAADGTVSVVQPMIEPLFYGKSEIELLNLVVTGEFKPGYELVRETWAGLVKGVPFESGWEKVLHDGILENRSPRFESFRIRENEVAGYIDKYSPDRGEGTEVIFIADYSVYDGRFGNNGWMQELPDPLTKLVWDNAALMSTNTAKNHDLKNGDLISIALNGKSLEIPIFVIPGHTDDVITLPLGYGQKEFGRVADGVGFAVESIRTLDNMHFASGVKITPLKKKHTLASTQNHGSMEGRPLIREGTLEHYRHDPKFAGHAVHVPDLQSLWNEHKYDKGYQWGMSIDLNACIGCGACIVACQSENNIPIVGKENADYGREMHWMRLDRYFGGSEENPQVGFQPVACHHCEMAPCEQVCPVAATVHDAEGINLMTYNRCIGTRYCSNNCAYKVRRFNFFNYTNKFPELIKMAQNPDVTVRSRGVMEKCTYCLQRLNRAKRTAKLEGRQLRDGEVKTACQQSCPVEAIHFGNILDKNSEIVKAKQADRTYEMLAEFNFRPRTSYQARLRNPNPALKE